MRNIFQSFAIALVLCATLTSLQAQYFGKNKPRYRSFDFEIRETPHFSIYNYTENKGLIDEIGVWCEEWYYAHQEALQDTLSFKNPLILYNNHAEFQQTNTIGGSIGVGTGGVTEAFKNRVILPFTFTRQQLHHVIGHELVHAFQYNIVINGDSTSLANLGNVPLWLVEGLAEYLSIGNHDPHTAMWMRDAVLHDDIPSIKDLNSGRYFPYRYGQTFWTYITGRYGDEIIRPLYDLTAAIGLEQAILGLTGLELETLSDDWVSAMRDKYSPYVSKSKSYGKPLIGSKNPGEMNISPSLSPNGKYVIFLSSRDVFSTDLYLADARSGEVIRKVSSSLKDDHLDAYNYLESSGTWSPRSDQFAFVAFKKGRNVLVIKDVENGKTIGEHNLDGVPAFTNPAWSPDGKQILVTGLVEGQTDIYSFDLRSRKVAQITNDIDAELQIQFSSAGDKIVYATDNRSLREGKIKGKWTFDIAELEMSSGRETIHDIFYGADNLNPAYDEDGNIFFLSNRDGYRNLYSFHPDSTAVYQETQIYTGISGITPYSPAISVAQSRDRIMYTLYDASGYNIIRATSKNFLHQTVDRILVDQEPGTLLGHGSSKTKIVDRNLSQLTTEAALDSVVTFSDAKYRPNFKLDYATGGGGIGVGSGVGTANTFGNYTSLAGGVGLLFGDMLGNNQLFTQLSLNGEILDFGGQLAYINRKNKLAWGLGLGHIPQRTGFQYGQFNGQFYEQVTDLIRIYDDNLTGFVHFPFSTTLRIEGSAGIGYRSFRYDQYKEVYTYDAISNSFFLVESQRERQEIGDELRFNQYYTLVKGANASVGTALVGDNAFFGLTSPLAGHRFRIGVDKFFGSDDYFATIVDLRKYFWLKPISIAIRGMSYNRFERNVNAIYPLFIGNMGFVRGYGSIIGQDQISHLDNPYFNQYIGSKIALANLEVRLPFTGPKQLATIPSKFLFTDINLFFDAGYAFNSFDDFENGEFIIVEEVDPDTGDQVIKSVEINPALAMSTGISLRLNLFGAMIVEPYLAWQLVDGGKRTFGLNIVPGW